MLKRRLLVNLVRRILIFIALLVVRKLVRRRILARSKVNWHSKLVTLLWLLLYMSVVTTRPLILTRLSDRFTLRGIEGVHTM